MKDDDAIIETILIEADTLIRARLAEEGIGEIPHVVVAVSPEGTAVLRCNCGRELLTDIASGIWAIAKGNKPKNQH